MSLNWDVCITGTDLEMKHLRLCQLKSIIPLFTNVYADLPSKKRLCLPSSIGPVKTPPSNVYLRQRKSPPAPTSLVWQIFTECLLRARDVLKIQWWGTSLVVQWLRIRLPMQGTWVRDLVREDPTCRGATKPMHHNYWACALEPASHNYWASVPQLLKPAHLEPVLRNTRSHHSEKPKHLNEE